jgi:hypothetical protein
MATGVATKMKERFGEQIDLEIHLVDSEEAAKYELRGATTVYINNEWVSLDVATNADKMEAYLADLMK